MPCPICTSKQTSYFAKKNNYIFQRCIVCKTVFLPILPSQKKLNEYYSKDFSYGDGLSNEKVIRNRSRGILKRLEVLAPYAETICDVGSGYGFFLDEVKKKKYIPFGIEPSKELAEHSRIKYSIPIFLGNLEKYEIKQQFDIVTCIHVVEHVLNPQRFLSRLLKLVKPGGLLFIETPNSDSHLLYMERENYTFLIPPDHLWLFSKESIKKLLPKNSSIISINTYSNSEHLMGIVKRIIKSLSLRAKNIHSEAIFVRSPRRLTPRYDIRKNISYLFFDLLLAPIFTGILNWYHKGSILELYIRK